MFTSLHKDVCHTSSSALTGLTSERGMDDKTLTILPRNSFKKLSLISGLGQQPYYQLTEYSIFIIGCYQYCQPRIRVHHQYSQWKITVLLFSNLIYLLNVTSSQLSEKTKCIYGIFS